MLDAPSELWQRLSVWCRVCDVAQRSRILPCAEATSATTFARVGVSGARSRTLLSHPSDTGTVQVGHQPGGLARRRASARTGRMNDQGGWGNSTAALSSPRHRCANLSLRSYFLAGRVFWRPDRCAARLGCLQKTGEEDPGTSRQTHLWRECFLSVQEQVAQLSDRQKHTRFHKTKLY